MWLYQENKENREVILLAILNLTYRFKRLKFTHGLQIRASCSFFNETLPDESRVNLHHLQALVFKALFGVTKILVDKSYNALEAAESRCSVAFS